MERKEFSFVWSGPTRYLEARRTEQVILDIINFAKERLLLVSYAAYRIPVLLEGLQKAIDRGIKVRFVLETEEDSMGHLRQDASDAFESIHGAEFFHWPIEKRDNTNGHGIPVMHAKCVISERSFLISSANLTDTAVNANMELGVLCHDKEKTAELLEQFDRLIDYGILKKLI